MRVHPHHLHIPKLNIDTSPNLRTIYVMRTIRAMVNKLSLILFPIYLFQVGQELQLFGGHSLPVQGILFVASFLALYYFASLVSAIPVGQILGRVGYHRGLIYSYLGRSLTFVLFFASHTQPLLLLPAAILQAMQSNGFWIAYHTLLAKNAQKTHMGSDLGLIQVLLQLISAISPAIAGLVGLYFGLEYLFLIGMIGPLIAAALSLKLDIKHEPDRVSLRECWAWMQESRFQKFMLANIGRQFNDQAIYAWPLYLFILFGAVDKVGYVQSISLFLAMTVTFFIASYLDKNQHRKPFLVSGTITSLLWVARSGISSVWHIAIADMVDKLTGNFHWLYFDSLFMRRGKGRQALSFFTYREMMMGVAGTLFWSLVIVAFLVRLDWIMVFALGMLGGIATLALEKKHSSHG